MYWSSTHRWSTSASASSFQEHSGGTSSQCWLLIHRLSSLTLVTSLSAQSSSYIWYCKSSSTLLWIITFTAVFCWLLGNVVTVSTTTVFACCHAMHTFFTIRTTTLNYLNCYDRQYMLRCRQHVSGYRYIHSTTCQPQSCGLSSTVIIVCHCTTCKCAWRMWKLAAVSVSGSISGCSLDLPVAMMFT